MKPYSGPVLPGPSGDPRRNSTTVQTLAGPVEPPKPQGRTWGEFAGDTGRGVVGGGVNLVGGLSQTVNLATGGAIDRAMAPVERLARTDGTPRGVAGTTQQASEAINRGLSADMQARQQNLAEQEGFWNSAKTVLTDPRLALQFASEQAAILASTGKVARATGRVGAERAAERIAERGKPTSPRAAQRVTERAAQQSAQTGIVGFAGAMGAGFSANDAINEAMGLPDDVWDANPDFVARAAEVGRDQAKQEMALRAGQRAGAIAGPISALAGRVAAPFEAKLFRGRLPGGGIGQVAKNVGSGAAREGIEETIQEGGEQFGANVGLSSINPNQRLMEGVPEAAGTGGALGLLIGGGLGGAGSIGGRGRTDAAPPEAVDPQPPVPPAGPMEQADPVQQAAQEVQAAEPAGTVIDPASGPMSKALATAAAEERGDGVVAPTVVPDPIDVEALSAADEAMAEQVAAQEAEQQAAAVEAAKPPKPASDTEILARIRTMSDAGQIIDAGQLQFMARQFNVPLEKVRAIRQQVRQEERELAAERAAESSSTIDPPSTRNVEDINDVEQATATDSDGAGRGDVLVGEGRPDAGPAELSGREPGAADDAQREAALPAENRPDGAGEVQGAAPDPQGVADVREVDQPGSGVADVSAQPGAAQAEPGAAPQPGPTDARAAVEGAAPAVAAAAAEAATSPSNDTPAPRPLSVDDEVDRAWAENYSRVQAAENLDDVSTVDIERAMNYAETVLQSQQRRKNNGEPYIDTIVDGMQSEIDWLRAAWNKREDRFDRGKVKTQKPAEKAKLAEDPKALPEGWNKTITKVRSKARALGIATEGKAKGALEAEIVAAVQPAAKQAADAKPKADKARLVPTRNEDGSIQYRAEPLADPDAAPVATAEPTPKPKPAAKANTIVTDAEAEEARALLRSKLGQLNSGVDPEMLQAGIKLSIWHMERGARKFAAYAKAMVADLGETVKPFLKSWYMGVKYDPRASAWTDMDTAAAVEAADIDTVLQEDARAQPDPTPEQAARAPAEATPEAAETDPEPAGAQPAGESGKVDFDAWFAGSKVVNPDGTPMRVFHGTRRAFDTFKVGSASGLGSGIYFTDNREQAAEEFGSGPGGRVIEAFVSIKNPATASIAAVRNPADGTRSEEAVENTQAWRDYDGPFKDPVDAWDEDVEFMGSVLRELGYDGIIERDSNNIEGLEILAFTPEQVRIAPVETAPKAAQTAPKEGQSDDLFSATTQERGAGPLEAAPAEAGAGAALEGAARQGAERSSEPDAGDARPAQRSRDDGRAGVAGREGGVSDSRSPAAGQRFGREPGNFVITDDVALGAGSETVKFTNNMKAIRLLKQLEAEKREATPEEQVTLATYVGWGGLPQAFPRPNGTSRKGWDKRVKELREALSDEEYAAARESTTDAHYTSREVVGGIYAGLKRLGFDGGRVLEPSVGTGNFIGLAPDWMRSKTTWSAVELDSITGRIASKLYPKARIVSGQGFQQVNVPGNYFDAAIGNPPFGSHAPFDANHKDLKGFSIHNFMFAKSIKSLKPGGVLAMVVSNQLLDKATSKQRRWFAENAKLLGAVRLPNTAFLANAGTEVTTDIVFMQKLHEGEVNTDTSWTKVGTVPDPAGGEAIPLNQYFIDNPDMMLGRMTREGKMRFKGQPALSAEPGADIAAQLAHAMDKLPANVMRKPEPVKPGQAQPVVEVTSDVPVYGHYIENGRVHQRLPDEFGDRRDRLVASEGKALERITGMLDIRDAMRSLMRAEMADANDAHLKMLRGRLNQLYDKFVAKHGYLNSPANARLLSDDPDSYRIRGLEKSYQKLDAEMAEVMGVEVPKGRKTVEVAEKADILRKRVFKPERELRVETANDALAVSLNTTGRVNVDEMARMLSITPEAVVEQLDGQVFNDPAEGWVTRDAYLSGNVKAKLAEARAAAERDPALQRNVEALETVQPADIAASDIHVQLGSPWVPASHIARFAQEKLGLEDARVSYVKALNKFVVNTSMPGSERFGTRQMSARDVFSKAVNREGITIYRTAWENGKEKRVVDGVATEQAMQVLEQMRQEFSDWVWADTERRRDISRVYNDTFNTNVARQFDGQFLSFPGKVDDSVIKFYPSQINAIWRAVQDGRVLLDHVVGAGKTFTVIGAVMTKRRMGLVKKPMIAVPNHLVQQWANDFAALYPNANILAVTKRDFETDRRKLLFSRIATGDWDAVIVAHSQQTAIAPPAEFEAAYIQEQIDQFDEAISAAKIEGEDNRTVKQLETAKKKFEAKKQAKVEGIKRDTDTSSFDEMGIDDLWVDEAHEFKNLSYVTRKRNVAGLGSPDGSQRAEDLFIKSRYLHKITGGRGINFATGTPVSNSLVEMFTMQRYLAFDELKARGIESFDNWANTFAEETTEMELDSSGRGLKAKTVLKNFFNAPEMMQIYSQFADVISLDDLKRQTLAATGKPWPVPKMKGGKQQNVIIPPSPATEAYIESNIIPRAEAISGERGRKPDPSEDNMLKVTNDARLAALDIRLKIPSAPDSPNSVVNVAVGNIMRIYRANAQRKGTQLVFSDLSTPKAAVASEKSALAELRRKASEGDEKAIAKLDRMSPDDIMALESDFSVYDDLKAKLISQGIPEREIAFIHDAKTDLQKQALFNRVKSGDVRVLIGSTSKMGAGTNVQNKLVALHHLDAPWRPSDLEQREGRIIRQGNEFYKADPEGFEVEIMRYAVERTYAGRMWQLIERKAAVVDQIRRADPSMRSFEDSAGSAASAAEMKAAATGNPLIIEQVELGLQIKKLEASRKGHANRIHDAQDKLENLESRGGPEARHKKRTAEIAKAEAFVAANPSDPFTIKLGTRTFTERADGAKAMAVAIIDAFKTRQRQGTAPIEIGRYRGMDLVFEREFVGDVLRAHNDALGTIARIFQEDLVKYDKVSGVGILTRLDNALTRTTQGGEASQQKLERERKQIAELKDLSESTFKQQAELEAAKDRLKVVTAELTAKPEAQVDAENLQAEDGAQSVAEAGASKAPSGSRTIARHINRITRQWKGDAPKVVVVQNQSELPREGFSDKRVEGFYDGRGTIYLVANNLPNTDRAEQVLAHEAFGHYGVDGVVGAQQWVQVIGQVAQMRANPPNTQVGAAIQSALRRYPSASPTTFAREVIAIMAERGLRAGFFGRVMAAVRRFLTGLGFKVGNWAESDLRAIVAEGMRRVEQGPAASDAGGARGRAFSAQEAFHGSAQRDLDRLSTDFAYTGEGKDAFGWGIYLASQKDVADFYRKAGGAIMRKPGGALADSALTEAKGDRAEAGRILMARKRRAKPAEAAEIDKAMSVLRMDLNRGQTYRATVPGPDVMLDWDAHYDDQPQAVRDAFDAIIKSDAIDPDTRVEWEATAPQNRTGRRMYSVIAVSYNTEIPGQRGASLELLKRGIKGLRYLDGQNRRPDGTANVSHNFVIFEDAAVSPLQPVFSLADPNTQLDAIVAQAAPNDTLMTRLANKIEDWKPSTLAMLTLRQLGEITKNYLPSAKVYVDLVTKMQTRRNQLADAPAKLSEKWDDLQRAARRDMRKTGAKVSVADLTASVMHDATIAGVDPAEAYRMGTVTLRNNDTIPMQKEAVDAAIRGLLKQVRRQGLSDEAKAIIQADIERLNIGMAQEIARAQAYPALQKRFAELPKAWQDLYRDVRDQYAKRADDTLNALLARINVLELDGTKKKALVDRMRAQFEDARIQAPYFPLARFGDYWVSLSKGATKRYEMAESKSARENIIASAQRDGWKVDAKGTKLDSVRSVDGASGTFVAEVNQMLNDNGVDKQVQDDVYQLFLRTLPELSTRKNFIHRKKVAGYSSDALRAFAGHMNHSAHQLARLEYRFRLDKAIDQARQEVSDLQGMADEDADRAGRGYDELVKRHEWVNNPNHNRTVQKLVSANFAFYLGITPAAAMVNMTQTAIVTFPDLASRYGVMNALNETFKAFTQSARHYGNFDKAAENADERLAYQQLQDMGAIDRTLAHDLAGLGENDSREYNPTSRKVMGVVSHLFHKAEVINRESAGMAAYRLARQAGKDHATAVKEASDVIWDTHFDYTNANRARFMQGNAAKVIFAFKQFSQGMTYFVGRAAFESIKGADPEVRAQARRRLIGTLGMTGVFSGVLGMPTMSLVFGVLNALNAVFGDDEEPWEAEVEFRNFLTDMLGPDAARIITTGPVEAITGIGIQQRTSLAELWYRDADRDLEGRNLANHIMEQVAGPIGGMGIAALTASSRIRDGLETGNSDMVWRGVETALPKAARDMMKAYRFQTQGANSFRGDPLVEDMGLHSVLYQAIGFSPGELNTMYAANRAVKNYEQYIMQRRSTLLDGYALTMRMRDPEGTARAVQRITRFNEAHPELAITMSTLRRSMQSRQRYSDRAVAGIVINPNLEKVREAGRFAD